MRTAPPNRIHGSAPPPVAIALPVAVISVFAPNVGFQVTVFPEMTPPALAACTAPGNVMDRLMSAVLNAWSAFGIWDVSAALRSSAPLTTNVSPWCTIESESVEPSPLKREIGTSSNVYFLPEYWSSS